VVADALRRPLSLFDVTGKVARVERGDLGARTGRGFRDWAPGEAEALRARVQADLAAAARRRPRGA